jgi:glycosyltransferase EpsJ
MSATGLISIIVPIYNIQRYLPKCLDSLLSQSHANIEIICIDDASDDNSVNIAMEYSDRYKQIQLICHDRNLGLGAARNTGLEYASGDLVGFVDSDDYVHPDMYKKLYRHLKETNADIVQCSAFYVDENGTKLSLQPNSFGSSIDSPLLHLYASSRSPIFIAAAWNKLYKKELFTTNHIQYPSHYFEDIPVMVQLLYFAKKIVSLKEGLYYYLQRNDSIVRQKSYAHLVNLIKSLQFSRKSIFMFLSAQNALIPRVIANYLGQLYWRTEQILNTLFDSFNFSEKSQLLNLLFSEWCGKIKTPDIKKLVNMKLSYNASPTHDLIISEILLALYRTDELFSPAPEIEATLQFLLAESFVRQKDYDFALTSFQKVLECDPQRLEVHLNRSDTLRYLKRFNQAFAEVEILEGKNSKFPGIWETRAKIWKAMGEKSMARKCLQKEYPDVDVSTMNIFLPEASSCS